MEDGCLLSRDNDIEYPRPIAERGVKLSGLPFD